MPKRWEEHSSPMMGDRAHSFINTQILENCARLVAVFWTRIGTPTGVSPSGTLEEIERHISSGRPAMLYFSETPVRLDSVDREQYETLAKFRQKCQARGLIESFESPNGFRDKFSRQLALTVNRAFSGIVSRPATQPANPPSKPELSGEAERLIIAASHDKNGEVLYVRSIQGLVISTNNETFFEPGSPRDEASWENALKDLLQQGFLESSGRKGPVYRVAMAGYDFADQIGRN